MTHMAISCVGCGSCEDVCPASIPISTIFKKAGKSIQEMFGYVPGKNLSEIVPICVFDTDELREVEN
jgi:formate dehydrogenase subunit beta